MRIKTTHKNYLIMAACLSAIAFQNTSYAGPDYLSLALGQTSVDTGIGGLTGTASLDEEDSSFKLIIGKNMSEKLSIEGFYLDYGESTLTGNTGDQFTFEGLTLAFIVDNGRIATSATALGGNALFKHKLGSNASLYGKLGLVRWDSDFEVSGSGIGSFSESETGIDLFFGVGVKAAVSKNIALAADFEIHDIDDSDVDVLSLYLIYNLK